MLFVFYDQGTDLVTGIFLNAPPKNKEHLNAKAFSNMKNLRLLKISNVHLPQGLNYLSSKLRYIHWDGYTSKSLPTIFEPKELVELIMPCSLMKRLWKGVKVRFLLMQKLSFKNKNYIYKGLIFSILLLFYNRVQTS